jgi:hypothetical protein
MAKKLLVTEMLEAVAKAEARKEKLELLKQFNCLELRDILKGAFDDTIEFTLPKGVPPIDEAEKKNYDKTRLLSETKKFRYFVKGGPGDQVNRVRREKMFIDILYRIDSKEIPLICHMKDKTLDGVYKGVTKKLVQEAFPGLIIK